MNCKLVVATAALMVAAGLASQPSTAQVVKAGSLTCNVKGGWGLVFGSTRDLDCTYADANGQAEHYTGHIDKFGVDIGYHAGGILAWAVLAPTTTGAKGAMAGNYAGVTGGAAVGVGGTANVLVGGSNNTISLQPVSIEGMAGLNVAAGIANLVLVKAPG